MAPARKTAGGAAKAQKPKGQQAPKPLKAHKAKATKKAAPVVVEEEEEVSDEEEEEEATIYEAMSDDSAVEDDVSDDNDDASDDDQEEAASDDKIELPADSDASDSEVDEEALLAGIRDSSGETDYSSDSESDTEGPARTLDLSSVASKVQKQVQKKRLAGKKPKPGVIYVGRIPHGFYESEMQGYFSQFGDIRKLRLSRNPHTGRSRHYAFIEFAHSDVAQIVADTMHNYLMFDRLLQCKVVPREKVHPRMFHARTQRVRPEAYLERVRDEQGRERTREEYERQVGRLVNKESRVRKRLAEAGVEYDFPGYKALRPKKTKHVKF